MNKILKYLSDGVFIFPELSVKYSSNNNNENKFNKKLRSEEQ